ncbi:hypothetical protein JCGZ_17738 [Jatropha curcas]|uniref:Uncharacterized protein n=1 Tax=Jatropha curcas TaxID=180498 RepID=A0A067K2U9_JATCU|nr:hypothetical protein JCGZ_17738 [Jatropha curcas]
MAANGARRILQFSLASGKTLLTDSTATTTRNKSCSFTSKAASLSGPSPKPSSGSRLSRHKLNFSRLASFFLVQ